MRAKGKCFRKIKQNPLWSIQFSVVTKMKNLCNILGEAVVAAHKSEEGLLHHFQNNLGSLSRCEKDYSQEENVSYSKPGEPPRRRHLSKFAQRSDHEVHRDIAKQPRTFFCRTLSLLVVTGSEAYFSHKVKIPKRLCEICWIKSYPLPMIIHFRYFIRQKCKIKKVVLFNILLSLLITKEEFSSDRCWHWYCEDLC